MDVRSGGPGSAHLNLDASPVTRDSVERLVKCTDYSGEFIRTKVRTTARGDHMQVGRELIAKAIRPSTDKEQRQKRDQCADPRILRMWRTRSATPPKPNTPGATNPPTVIAMFV